MIDRSSGNNTFPVLAMHITPATGSSPFSLMFGRQARMPVDIMLGTTTPTPSTVPQYVLNLRNSLETAYEYVRSQMGHKQEQQKDRYDARTHGKAFRVGDQVWLRNPAVPRGKSRESSIGPGRVHSVSWRDSRNPVIVSSTFRLPGSGWWCTLIG